MKPDTPQSGTPVTLSLPIHEAEVLTGPDGRALIRYKGGVWVLRITRAGKLILTK